MDSEENRMIDVAAAIAVLQARDDVNRLLNLNRIRAKPSLARSAEYRREFNYYYRVRQRSETFYKSFYDLLENAAKAERKPPLREVLLRLYQDTGERHLSFGSKLLATVDDSTVIFDRNVATTLGVPTYPPPKEGWLEILLDRYSRVRDGILGVVARPDWPTIAAKFDASFPIAAHLPAIRKADFLVWAGYKQKQAPEMLE
jgi:hypothetical protein